jgi:hypothetical protein
MVECSIPTPEYLNSLLVALDDHVQTYTEMGEYAATQDQELVAMMWHHQAIAAANIARSIRLHMGHNNIPEISDSPILGIRIL